MQFMKTNCVICINNESIYLYGYTYKALSLCRQAAAKAQILISGMLEMYLLNCPQEGDASKGRLAACMLF